MYMFNGFTGSWSYLNIPLFLVYVLMYYLNSCCIGIKFILFSKTESISFTPDFLKSCVLCYVPDVDYQRQSDFTRNLKSKVYWSDKQRASGNVVFPDWRHQKPKYSAVNRHVSSSAQGCWVSAPGCRIPSTTVDQYALGCRVSTLGCQIRSTAMDT